MEILLCIFATYRVREQSLQTTNLYSIGARVNTKIVHWVGHYAFTLQRSKLLFNMNEAQHIVQYVWKSAQEVYIIMLLI